MLFLVAWPVAFMTTIQTRAMIHGLNKLVCRTSRPLLKNGYQETLLFWLMYNLFLEKTGQSGNNVGRISFFLFFYVVFYYIHVF